MALIVDVTLCFCSLDDLLARNSQTPGPVKELVTIKGMEEEYEVPVCSDVFIPLRKSGTMTYIECKNKETLIISIVFHRIFTISNNYLQLTYKWRIENLYKSQICNMQV